MMQALLLENIQRCRVANIPAPTPTPDARILRVTHCGICRTDAKMWRQGHRDLLLPRVPGHEIHAVDTEIGKPYVLWPGESCGTCRACSRGLENLCEKMQVLGFHRDGGFAEYVVAARRQCIGVPSKLPPELAVLAEPMACGLNALDRIRVRKGERLLIIGAGTVGLLLAIAATARGAFPEMVETSPEKRKRSTPIGNRLGIPIYDKPGTRPPYAAIIPAAPTCSALESALQSIEPGGRLCLFSGVSAAEPVTPPLSDVIHYRQLSAVGAYGCTRKQMRQALALLAIHQDSASQLVEKIVKLEGVAALFPEILEGTLFKCVVQLDSA